MTVATVASLGRLNSPATLREATVAQLREAIVSGRLAPGTLLKDAELAARLGLSATPVREALVELAGDGLVEIQSNRLKRVAPIDIQAMVELLEVQYSLWRLGYAWGIPRVGAAELERLRAAHAVYAKAVKARDVAGAIDGAFAFHRVLMDASGNRELVRVTLDRLPLIRRFILVCAPSIVTQDSIGSQKATLKALARGDAEAVLSIFDEITPVLVATAKALRDKPGNPKLRKS